MNDDGRGLSVTTSAVDGAGVHPSRESISFHMAVA